MATQESGIAIAPETIGHLLEAKNLQVPLSQRSSRWEKEHVTDLYHDIDAAIAESVDEYFVGSVVSIKETSSRRSP